MSAQPQPPPPTVLLSSTVFRYSNMEPTESSTADKGEAQNFGAPFDAANADVILRSSQSIDFRVRKANLSDASPFFETMFSLPQQDPRADNHKSQDADDYVDGLPVVQMQESTTTLHHFLTAVCPRILLSLPSSFEECIPVLAAAKKFEMHAEMATFRTAMRAAGMYDAPGTPREVLRAYGTACREGLEEEATSTAGTTLSHPTYGLGLYGDAIRSVSGNALHTLLCEYDQDSRNEVFSVLEDAVRMPLGRFPLLSSCRDLGAYKTVYRDAVAPKWWVDYWNVILDEVESGMRKQTAQAIVNGLDLYKAMSNHAHQSACKSCLNMDTVHVEEYITWLAGEITRASKTHFDFERARE
ncbi:hypothetical protein EVG20_g6302 [Dentipellis fragilis]|uniref:BTB domain-containing protein n=1 Tax=Dentipellis fragilis TaxID=205917 RepID=A0A4Y9YNK3_9AGAM|nr:hypothetical protein EVG20_g6302 [Dentipellis fragilis]